MASTIASTLALSRPSEKLGTHSTRVDIREKEYHREWDRNVDIRVPHPRLSVLWRDRVGLLNARARRPHDSRRDAGATEIAPDYCCFTKSSSTALRIRSGGSNPSARMKS